MTSFTAGQFQSAVLARSNNTKSPISVPMMDQRNIFNFENPKLLHGIPTNMEPKQFVGLQQSQQQQQLSYNNQILIPVGGQTRSNGNRQPGNYRNDDLLQYPEQFNQDDLLTAILKQVFFYDLYLSISNILLCYSCNLCINVCTIGIL